jgi:hypothetical protein
VYFWLNGRENSWLKVRSSVIRLVKLAFQKHGISMPDEAREIVFPQGVPVTVLAESSSDEHAARNERVPTDTTRREGHAASTTAEAGLYSEAGATEEQARQAHRLKSGENLLEVADVGPAAGKQG